MSISNWCCPDDNGISADPYPRITSRPMKSIPYTLIAILGQPYTFVVLNDMSIGKFQIMSSSEFAIFLHEVCDSPVSKPDVIVQSFPKLKV